MMSAWEFSNFQNLNKENQCVKVISFSPNWCIILLFSGRITRCSKTSKVTQIVWLLINKPCNTSIYASQRFLGDKFYQLGNYFAYTCLVCKKKINLKKLSVPQERLIKYSSSLAQFVLYLLQWITFFNRVGSV